MGSAEFIENTVFLKLLFGNVTVIVEVLKVWVILALAVFHVKGKFWLYNIQNNIIN